MNQREWAISMLKRYLKEKNADSVGIRRLHYFIVSLPEEERMMPAKGGMRPYENTLKDYKNLSKLLTDARINGEIPFEWIIDEKNEPIIEMPARRDLTAYLDYNYELKGYIPYIEGIEKMEEWDDFIDTIEFDVKVTPPRFKHQTHRIVVAIEKATARDKLERLCRKYGADLLIFSGQFSLTRVHDVVSRAMAENKPIALLYISDLDCAGWFMPKAFFRRINEIYPHEEHKVVRVALTREQAIAFNLPSAFDPDDKGYSETQKRRFIEESGGRECIELDALDEDILIQLLEEELKKWAMLDKDMEEYNKTKEEYEKKAKELKDNLDLSDIKDEYNEVKEEFNELVEQIEELFKQIKDKIDEIEEKKYNLEQKIKERLREVIKGG